MMTTKARIEIDFLDLSDRELTERDFRGGSKDRRSNFPWEVPGEHKGKMRALLEANGFAVTQPIWAQPKFNGDGFILTQEREDR